MHEIAIDFVQRLLRPRGCHGDRGRKDFSASSSEEEQAAAPSLSLLSLPSFKDVGNDSGGEKEVWVSVFTYLSRAELLACMTVCKAWYKWYASHTHTHTKSIIPALLGLLYLLLLLYYFNKWLQLLFVLRLLWFLPSHFCKCLLAAWKLLLVRC